MFFYTSKQNCAGVFKYLDMICSTGTLVYLTKMWRTGTAE